MTQVTGTGIKNVAGDIAATGTVTISTKPRMSGSGAYIDGRSKKSSIVAGAMTSLEIEPGPVKIAVSVGSSYDTFDAIVPETGPVTLAALKEQTYTYEPPVVSQVAQDAARAEEAAALAEQYANQTLAMEEDPPGSGLYVLTSGTLVEDPDNTGLYLIGV